MADVCEKLWIFAFRETENVFLFISWTNINFLRDTTALDNWCIERGRSQGYIDTVVCSLDTLKLTGNYMYRLF